MGTPAFAVASLQALITANFNVVAVVTAPDKPAGRGMQLRASAVKEFAVANNIPVLQPEKLKNEAFIAQLASYNAHLQVVVAFRMLPEIVWNMPPLGTVNVHGSLLPKYRGAAPINWAIINGETETGVTIFKLQHAIDTGDILGSASMPITPQETAGTLHDKMMQLGATTLVQVLEQWLQNNITPQPQPEGEPILAPKIFTETCTVHWHQPAQQVYNLIRGLAPYPGAFTYLQQKVFKILACSLLLEQHGYEPGTVLQNVEQGTLQIACTNGWILCEEVQLEGKKRMLIADFCRGNKLPQPLIASYANK